MLFSAVAYISLAVFTIQCWLLLKVDSDVKAVTNSIASALTNWELELKTIENQKKSGKRTRTTSASYHIISPKYQDSKEVINGNQTGSDVTREDEDFPLPRPPPFVQDTICGGCRQIVIGGRVKRRVTCGSAIKEEITKRNISSNEAVSIVARNRRCNVCLPESCSSNAKNYWRYDAAAPKIIAAQSHYLPSVDSNFRIPKAILDFNNLDKIEQYMSHPENQSPKRQYYFDYNPSIVQLPESYSHIRQEYPDALYLASYRVSTVQSCFPTNITFTMLGGDWKKSRKLSPKDDLMGLALLDKNLNLIQDVVVEIPQFLTRWYDFRLFVLKGQLYVTSNCEIFPLWLNPPKNVMQPADLSTKVEIIPNKFSSPLIVGMPKKPIFCSPIDYDVLRAKNLNYFIDAKGQSIVEINIAESRYLRSVNISNFSSEISGMGTKPQDEFRYETSAIPVPSFFTRDELDLAEQRGFYARIFTTYHGSACCISIDVPPAQKFRSNSSTLLLGITHVKTPHNRNNLKGVVESNQYLSKLYAFEPAPPYKIVAYSGYFCFPAKPESKSTNNNPLTAFAPTFRQLKIADTLYNCPSIHFISGMVEKADDDTKLIIGYGVQDCTSWFVEVDKAEVINLLFEPPVEDRM
eukprot:CAMPEP_0178917694 /NCGR_PEP_ID=MMETSP0786-20121207/13394_1 /TAXON_ID=186022 /ORGANISM="Thalassionema frauenfeldii, Strain CCMP 1798" /LENGTH=633 /DNA_ID=CAMNT_0020591283 /DNA_START=116 /DNA_END=2017 /DNA_ORIENTATION=+